MVGNDSSEVFLIDDADHRARTLLPLPAVAPVTDDRVRAVSLVRAGAPIAFSIDETQLGDPLGFGDITPTRRWSSVEYRIVGVAGGDTALAAIGTVYDGMQHTHLVVDGPNGEPLTGLLSDQRGTLQPPADSALVRIVLAVADSSRPYRALITRPASAPFSGSLAAPFGSTPWVRVAADQPFVVGATATNGSGPSDSATVTLGAGAVANILVLRDPARGLLEFYRLDDSTGADGASVMLLGPVTSAIAQHGAEVGDGLSLSVHEGVIVVRAPRPLDPNATLHVIDVGGRIVASLPLRDHIALPPELVPGVYIATTGSATLRVLVTR